MEYVLIIMMHVGVMGSGNSNSITTATYSTMENCVKAGREATKMVNGTTKEINFVCTKR